MLVTPFSAFGLSARSVLMLDSHVYTVMLESFTINFITRQKNYFASLSYYVQPFGLLGPCDIHM